MATIIIPTPLRKFTQQQSRVQLQGDTVQEVITDLVTQFPDLKNHLLDEHHRLRSFINLFVEDDDIRDLDHEQTKLSNDTVVSIVPAIAGGR